MAHSASRQQSQGGSLVSKAHLRVNGGSSDSIEQKRVSFIGDPREFGADHETDQWLKS